MENVGFAKDLTFRRSATEFSENGSYTLWQVCVMQYNCAMSSNK